MLPSKFFEEGETTVISNKKHSTLISESEKWSEGSDVYVVFLRLKSSDCASN